MRGTAQHLHVYSPAIRIDIQDISERYARFTFAIVVSGLVSDIQVSELSLGVALGVFRLLVGSEFRPLRVALNHRAVSPPAAYGDFFGCPVHVDESYCGFDVNVEDLGRRMAGGDQQVRELAARYLATRDASDTVTAPHPSVT